MQLRESLEFCLMGVERVQKTSRTGLQYTHLIASASKRKRLIKLARATNASRELNAYPKTH